MLSEDNSMVTQTDQVVINGVKVILAVISILSNMSLVYVTAKTKSLKGSCNILIAVNALCIAVYSLTYFTQFLVVLLATNPSGIQLSNCFFLMIVPIFFLSCQQVLYPLIAFDRLVGALFPIWQRTRIQQNQRGYLFLALLGTAAYGIAIVFASFVNSVIVNPNKMVLCMTTDPPPALFSICTLLLDVASVTFYLTLWFFVKFRHDEKNPDNRFTKQILKSLMALFLLELFGWMLNMVVVNTLHLFFPTSTVVSWYIISGMSMMTMVALILNAPVLYALSSEYRCALFCVFGFGKNRVAERQRNEQRSIRTVHPEQLRSEQLEARRGSNWDSALSREVSVKVRCRPARQRSASLTPVVMDIHQLITTAASNNSHNNNRMFPVRSASVFPAVEEEEKSTNRIN